LRGVIDQLARDSFFLGKSFDDLFLGDYSSEADLGDVVRLGDLCRNAAQAAAQSFTYGRNDGRKTTKIILESLFASA